MQTVCYNNSFLLFYFLCKQEGSLQSYIYIFFFIGELWKILFAKKPTENHILRTCQLNTALCTEATEKCVGRHCTYARQDYKVNCKIHLERCFCLPEPSMSLVCSLSNKIVWMCVLLYYASFLWEIFEECYTQYFNGLKWPKPALPSSNYQ